MTGDDRGGSEMGEILLRDYTAADEALVRALYEESFPASVRAPWSDLVEHRDDERFLVLIDVDATPVGMALIRRLGDTDMAFVRYLAVTADRRDRGLGTQLLAHLRDALRSEEISVLLLDVEDPRGEHAEQDRRRIAFYERCGLDLLDVPDYSPPEHGETGEIVPLLLMGEVLDGGPPLAGSRLDAAVAAVMLHRYGVEG
ncbi:MAG: GNAT family N-acetyltransferase [Candidatus Nanopelagicales bacterium]